MKFRTFVCISLPRAIHGPTVSSTFQLIILIILSEERKLWRSSLGNFLQSPDISFLLGPNILLSTLLSNKLSLCFSFNGEEKYIFIYFNSTLRKCIVK